MQVEVYPTDADAVDAAAALVAERVREAAARGRVRVALGGGRSSRATLVALASRGDLPWAKVDWCLADERCGEAGDPLAHARVVRDSLLVPRGVPAGQVYGPAVDGTPEEVAARYAATLSTLLAGGGFDVVVLGIGADAALGALAPGSAALEAAGLVAVTAGTGADDPPRVTLTRRALEAARHVIVTAVGPDTAAPVARALRDGNGPAGCALPSERVTWVMDRDAAGELLATATPVE